MLECETPPRTEQILPLSRPFLAEEFGLLDHDIVTPSCREASENMATQDLTPMPMCVLACTNWFSAPGVPALIIGAVTIADGRGEIVLSVATAGDSGNP